MLWENVTKNMKTRKTRKVTLGCNIKEQVLKAYIFKSKIIFKKSEISKLLSINFMGLFFLPKGLIFINLLLKHILFFQIIS